jgi:hypothetical protein
MRALGVQGRASSEAVGISSRSFENAITAPQTSDLHPLRQRCRIELNGAQARNDVAQMIVEHKQSRTPNLTSENQSGRSNLRRALRAKRPYSYTAIQLWEI